MGDKEQDEASSGTGGGSPTHVDFYWRPGCMFSASLRRSLKRRCIPLERHNIWTDSDAAAIVRSVAAGSETVPTIAVGGRALVNPTPRAVEELLAEVAPELLDSANSERDSRGNWLTRALGSN